MVVMVRPLLRPKSDRDLLLLPPTRFASGISRYDGMEVCAVTLLST